METSMRQAGWEPGSVERIMEVTWVLNLPGQSPGHETIESALSTVTPAYVQTILTVLGQQAHLEKNREGEENVCPENLVPN